MLKSDFEFYLEHQDELARKYRGKFVVIKDKKVLGAYDTEIEAVDETAKTEALGTFLVQKCERGGDSVKQTFHSRVSV